MGDRAWEVERMVLGDAFDLRRKVVDSFLIILEAAEGGGAEAAVEEGG